MASLNLNLKPTQRGFIRADFTDLYGAQCSIQESSLATDDAIWLGLNEGTHHHTGGSLCVARMHLSRDQVAELIPVLQYFVENGHLPSLIVMVGPGAAVSANSVVVTVTSERRKTGT